MERPSVQLSLAGMLGLVACVALNIWLFRLGTLLGIIGLNISKHLIIAYLCQVLGVDKRVTPEPDPLSKPTRERPSRTLTREAAARSSWAFASEARRGGFVWAQIARADTMSVGLDQG